MDMLPQVRHLVSLTQDCPSGLQRLAAARAGAVHPTCALLAVLLIFLAAPGECMPCCLGAPCIQLRWPASRFGCLA